MKTSSLPPSEGSPWAQEDKVAARSDHTDCSDEDLMALLRDGDETSLKTLMERWENPLVGFILRYTGNHADALDLAQEVFVRVYESRKRYRPKGNFSTWMFTIAANLCRNRARWISRHPSAPVGNENQWASSAVDPRELPDASARRRDEASQIRAAVQKLPQALRTVVLLYEFECRSQAEIGTILGCTAKAVETRLYRARKMLQSRLQHLLETGTLGPSNNESATAYSENQS